ncbi:MAG: type II toxin-antitoxin system PemK/MazF family toxin [Blastocatellia bacterium]
MKLGDIVLLPFPFAEFTNRKVRPAVVVCETNDKYKDIVVCAVSSVVPSNIGKFEILILPDKENNLRAESIIKVDRIVTAKSDSIIITLGQLNSTQIEHFTTLFRDLVA